MNLFHSYFVVYLVPSWVPKSTSMLRAVAHCSFFPLSLSRFLLSLLLSVALGRSLQDDCLPSHWWITSTSFKRSLRSFRELKLD